MKLYLYRRTAPPQDVETSDLSLQLQLIPGNTYFLTDDQHAALPTAVRDELVMLFDAIQPKPRKQQADGVPDQPEKRPDVKTGTPKPAVKRFTK